MKRNILNKTYWIAAFVVLLFAACINESDTSDKCPQSYNIRVSVRSGNEQTRTSDLIVEEKIKRYDIFIYESSTGALVRYFGESGLADKEAVTVTFESNADFTTDKDIYVVVNNADWEGKDEAYMKEIVKADLIAYELNCKQNVTKVNGKITDFAGYKKSVSENEPFVMSASRTGYNFSTDASHATLQMELRRTYAKVILKFKTNLTAENDPAWIDLKTIRVRAINNIPTTANLFNESGASYVPTRGSYIYEIGSEYELESIDADLSKGAYTFDAFSADRLALRLFPHDPSGNVDAQATSLLVDFEVGEVGKTDITHTFKRLVKIGNVDNGYRIDPNYAYIINIAYGKTTNNVTVNCQVVPWNLVSVEEEVDPDW